MDTFSDTDAFIVVYTKENGDWVEFDRTEIVVNNNK